MPASCASGAAGAWRRCATRRQLSERSLSARHLQRVILHMVGSLLDRSLAKEPVAALAEQQVQERSNEVNSQPDYSNPQDLLDNREIVLKYHHSHPDVANDWNEQTGKNRDPGGTTDRPIWTCRTFSCHESISAFQSMSTELDTPSSPVGVGWRRAHALSKITYAPSQVRLRPDTVTATNPRHRRAQWDASPRA